MNLKIKTPKEVAKKVRKNKGDKLIREMSYWRYILAKNKYFVGMVEGYFNEKNKLLFWTSEFEEVKVGLDEGTKVVGELLHMMDRDLYKNNKVLDLTKSYKKAVEEYNK